jgi:DNA mismatch repair protein MutS
MRRTLDALGAFVRRVGVPQARERFEPPQYLSGRTRSSRSTPTRASTSNLHRPLGSNPKATLLATIDRTRTAMGSRLLARWLSAPLIAARRSRARRLRRGVRRRRHYRRARRSEVLHACFDLERIAQKMRFRRALPRDLNSLRRTLALLDPLSTRCDPALPPLLAGVRGRLGGFEGVRDDLAATIVDEPPATLADGGVIRPGGFGRPAECVALRATRARA